MNIEELQAQWQKQDTTQIKDIDMEKLRKNAIKFQKNIRSRNWGEWLACLLVAAIFTHFALKSPTLWSQVMNWDIVLSAFIIAAVIFYRGRVTEPADTALTTDAFVHWERRNIKRQILLLANVRYWYVGPMFLGMAGLAVEPMLNGNISTGSITHLVGACVIAGFLIWLNEVSAVKSLRKRLEALS